MATRKMPQKLEPEKKVEVKMPVVDETLKLVVANCHILNVREKPSRDAKVLVKIPSGTIVIVDKLVGDWLHVLEFGNEKEKSAQSVSGYIMAVYAKEV
jgi:uncharacterized protein YgiM (DUF1202 family)